MSKPALLSFLMAVSFVALGDTPRPPTQVCVDTNCESENSAGGSAIKWNPGHYMLVFRGSSHESITQQRITEVCKESALRGLQVKLDWGDLESEQGVYHFQRIDDMYGALERCGKRLVLQVQAVVFNTEKPGAAVPEYMLAGSAFSGGVAATRNGFIARLWEKPVMDRFIKLAEALGARYDSKPYFEGIILTETSTSGVRDTYTAAGFISQLERAIKAFNVAWPTTNVIVFNNFLQQSTDEQFVNLVKFLRENRSSVGGPDTLPPPHGGTEGERIYRGEIGGIDFRRKMPAMFAVQTPELGGKEGTFTPRQLHEHCVGTNKCSHIFWIRNINNGGPEQNWDTGILPFLRQNPKTDEYCPENYPGCKS